LKKIEILIDPAEYCGELELSEEAYQFLLAALPDGLEASLMGESKDGQITITGIGLGPKYFKPALIGLE